MANGSRYFEVSIDVGDVLFTISECRRVNVMIRGDKNKGTQQGQSAGLALVIRYLGRITTRPGASPSNSIVVCYYTWFTCIDLEIGMDEIDSQEIAQETPAEDVFIAPSIHEQEIFAGTSYTHHTALPELIASDLSTECVLGVDEAGRGPVLGSYHSFPKHSQNKS